MRQQLEFTLLPREDINFKISMHSKWILTFTLLQEAAL